MYSNIMLKNNKKTNLFKKKTEKSEYVGKEKWTILLHNHRYLKLILNFEGN